MPALRPWELLLFRVIPTGYPMPLHIGLPAVVSSFEVDGDVVNSCNILTTHPLLHTLGLCTHTRICATLVLSGNTLDESVARCQVCHWPKGTVIWVPMERQPPPQALFVRVSANLMDLQGLTRGYHYKLSIVNHHTCFLQLVPLRNKKVPNSLCRPLHHLVWTSKLLSHR